MGMRMTHMVITFTLVCIILLAPARAGFSQTLKPEVLAQFEQKTGLMPVEIPETQGLPR